MTRLVDTLTRKWLPSDETAVNLDRFMHYTLYGQDPG
jgi:hypothetical protein